MRTPRRLRAAAVAAVVPLTLLAACEPGAEAKAGAASAGALDRYYDQKPAFEACEPPPTPGAAEPKKPWPGAKFEWRPTHSARARLTRTIPPASRPYAGRT
ncbi:hypothetical protein OG331_05325 [Streptomyces sp. NBC_01017]|uniref:hypothetical protein n=1 Tax=Streptomyces sp. NBC_01017 TaxID=2903721 RepID=UPI003865AE8D|nr:hypothetical protein OG331_05325 [Streptomyces sp. NBC_01017]